ncbi:MAG: MEKHLA domain-containing protein [Cyanobacteria bacterium J083]|nr:MAG: MEKHLA domain-containing protein [Cyanobacteria bacterium J083]
MREEIWQQSVMINWTQILLDNFVRLLNYELIPRHTSVREQAKNLYYSRFVVVSHGTELDPILNYGNQTALQLWEMNWEQFSQTPSRLTAEPINRQAREKMLKQANQQGYITDYQGVRISRTGKRFLIKQAIVWQLIDNNGKPQGQAATFSNWRYLKQDDCFV